MRGTARYYRTSEHERRRLVDRVPVSGPNYPFRGIDVAVPPAGIFTLTNVA